MDRDFLPFSIPIAGSKTGLTVFVLLCDSDFFARFPDCPVGGGNLEVTVTLDKRPDMALVHFAWTGRLATICDRCTADILLPVTGEWDLVVKYGPEFQEDDEVVVLPPDMTELNVARYIYECALLSLPVRRVYNCEDDVPRPCNMEVLEYLHRLKNEGDSRPEGGDLPFQDLKSQINSN